MHWTYEAKAARRRIDRGDQWEDFSDEDLSQLEKKLSSDGTIPAYACNDLESIRVEIDKWFGKVPMDFELFGLPVLDKETRDALLDGATEPQKSQANTESASNRRRKPAGPPQIDDPQTRDPTRKDRKMNRRSSTSTSRDPEEVRSERRERLAAEFVKAERISEKNKCAKVQRAMKALTTSKQAERKRVKR
jgi:hypothetical protein